MIVLYLCCNSASNIGYRQHSVHTHVPVTEGSEAIAVMAM